MGKFRSRLLEFLLFMSKTMREVGWSFVLWSMLYLEGWSSRLTYFIGAALLESFSFEVIFKVLHYPVYLSFSKKFESSKGAHKCITYIQQLQDIIEVNRATALCSPQPPCDITKVKPISRI